MWIRNVVGLFAYAQYARQRTHDVLSVSRGSSQCYLGSYLYIWCTCTVRTVYIDLTRFAIQVKSPDGKWTRKPLAYRESNNDRLRVTLFLNIFTLLAVNP